MRDVIKTVLLVSMVLLTALSATGAVTASDAGTDACVPAMSTGDTIDTSVDSGGDVSPDCGTSECDIDRDCDEKDWW